MTSVHGAGTGPVAGAGAGDGAGVGVDVVVAGAGAAGLAASLAAAQAGRSVLLLEAEQGFRTACNTALSTAMIPAGGTRWQREAGIDDSPEQFLSDVRHKTHGEADDAVSRALTGVAPDLVQWLADRCGVDLTLVTDFDYPGHSSRRCHTVHDRSGRTLHAALLAAARSDPGIEMVVPSRLVDVITDDAGSVIAARSQAPDGSDDEIRCGAVILATNGFGADRDMVSAQLPAISAALYFGGVGSRGDAIRIGQRLGADTACLDAYQGHGSVATPQSTLLTWAVVMHGGILVNARGERFGDESSGYSEFAEQVLAQPGGVAWSVFDRRIDGLCRSFSDYQRCREAHAIRWADDVDSLAEAIGAPAATLRATLGRAGDPADPFGRSHWEGRLQPPYAAVRVTGALFHTQGGLCVDGSARVLRDGRPIPGLYAAGGAAVGMSGHGAAGYLAGNGLLAALGLGYLAGRSCGESGLRTSVTSVTT